jgi:hypothetical protein
VLGGLRSALQRLRDSALGVLGHRLTPLRHQLPPYVR